MGKTFWLKRALFIYITVAVVLLFVELLKGHLLIEAVVFASVWSLLSTTVFIATRYYYARKGVACALCNDTPQQDND